MKTSKIKLNHFILCSTHVPIATYAANFFKQLMKVVTHIYHYLLHSSLDSLCLSTPKHTFRKSVVTSVTLNATAVSIADHVLLENLPFLSPSPVWWSSNTPSQCIAPSQLFTTENLGGKFDISLPLSVFI